MTGATVRRAVSAAGAVGSTALTTDAVVCDPTAVDAVPWTVATTGSVVARTVSGGAVRVTAAPTASRPGWAVAAPAGATVPSNHSAIATNAASAARAPCE
jgi:hypothetical protein